ncbi:MAG: hypothetical protein KC549_00975 [Myxococcales bacterium]|nr:hypothetical protein [Myxococcales bacterium]
MFESDLLLIWLPVRQQLGAVAPEVAKLGLRAVEGCVEPAGREHYRDRGGLLLSVVGFEVRPAEGGVVLPRPVHALLDALVAANPEGFEAVLWTDPPRLAEERPVRRRMLHGPVAAGVRYQVFP